MILFLFSLLFSRTLERYLLLFKCFVVVQLHLKSFFLSSHLFGRGGSADDLCLATQGPGGFG